MTQRGETAGADLATANATLFERRLDRQGEQIPCESPRSSTGTSTRTAAGLSCPAHHAHTVRIGRSGIRLRSATTPPWTCGPRNSRGVIVLFVAMNLLSLSMASRVPCELQHGRID
jgi:hypothetical protein